ncbi:MAG TPA: hypothetical protein VGC92_04685, partial [Phenylobacterium sp.]
MADVGGATAGSATAQVQPSGLALYAASMRNLLPRLVSSSSTGIVAACYLGWGWALAWSIGIWASMWIA